MEAANKTRGNEKKRNETKWDEAKQSETKQACKLATTFGRNNAASLVGFQLVSSYFHTHILDPLWRAENVRSKEPVSIEKGHFATARHSLGVALALFPYPSLSLEHYRPDCGNLLDQLFVAPRSSCELNI